jgi:CheY-like chemotaxis protein
MIVLIVDDDPEEREMFAAVVKAVSSTITCVEAGDGEEGLKVIKDQLDELPDFIFLDLKMPGMNGVHFLREIRKNKYTKDVPVIIYSTTFPDADKEECKKLNARFLQKAFSVNDMAQKLADIFFK